MTSSTIRWLLVAVLLASCADSADTPPTTNVLGPVEPCTSPGPVWANQLPSINELPLQTDSTGAIVMAGWFGSSISVTIGGTELFSALPTSKPNTAFVAKYANDGTHLWSRAYRSIDGVELTSLALDSNDNIIVGGYFKGKVHFGGMRLTSFGVDGDDRHDAFLAKLDPNGDHIWSTTISGPDFEGIFSVAVDEDDNIITAGSFDDEVTCAGTTVSDVNANAFLCKFSSAGQQLWMRAIGGTQSEAFYVVAGGQYVVGGTFSGIADFGDGPVDGGMGDVFLLAYDKTGVRQWSRTISGPSRESLGGLGLDLTTGDFVVAGYFNTTTDFGGGTVFGNPPGNMYLAKYSATNQLQWVNTYTDTTASPPSFWVSLQRGVQVDSMGRIFASGTFKKAIDFGGAVLVSAGSDTVSDVFVLQTTSGGQFVAANNYGGTFNERVFSLTISADGHPVIAGTFRDSIDFCGASLAPGGIGNWGYLAKAAQ